MRILLYKKGTTHKIDGVNCDIKRVEPEQFHGRPDEGWYLTPKDIPKEPKQKKKRVIKCQEQVN